MNIPNVVIDQSTNQIWPSEILQSTNYCVLTSPDLLSQFFPCFLQEWVEGLGTRLAHNEPLPQLHMDKPGVTSDIQRVAGEAADERRKRLELYSLRTKAFPRLVIPCGDSPGSSTHSGWWHPTDTLPTVDCAWGGKHIHFHLHSLWPKPPPHNQNHQTHHYDTFSYGLYTNINIS